jgi:plastocyanin
MTSIFSRRGAPGTKGRPSRARGARRRESLLAGLAAVVAVVAVGLLPVAAGRAWAEEGVYNLTIKDHKFTPDTIEVPAGRKVKLVIRNEDATPEEFDSSQLHREKVVPGGAEGVVYIGPLKPGTYDFIGEYHEATAKGRVVVK